MKTLTMSLLAVIGVTALVSSERAYAEPGSNPGGDLPGLYLVCHFHGDHQFGMVPATSKDPTYDPIDACAEREGYAEAARAHRRDSGYMPKHHNPRVCLGADPFG